MRGTEPDSSLCGSISDYCNNRKPRPEPLRSSGTEKLRDVDDLTIGIHKKAHIRHRVWAFHYLASGLSRGFFLQAGAEGELDERLLLHVMRLG